ncbi:MAG: FecR family protein [Bacteroidota bacterium]
MSDPDEIILKYLEENISLEDQHKLTRWLEENNYNEEVLKKVRSYWENYSQDYSIEKKAVHDKVFGNLGLQKPRSESIQSSWPKFYLGIAAALLILITSSIIYWQLFSSNPVAMKEADVPMTIVEKTSLAGQKITTVLPDGTTVNLNCGSKLLVPEKFADDIRTVELHGEAFFDVVKDESKPFHIITKDFTVRVLGTSFNVNAYDGISNYVAVKEGVVNVKSDSHRSVDLNAHQMVEISENGKLSELYEVDEKMVFGWVDQVLSFDDQSITQVLNKVSLWYGVDIVIENKNMSKKLFTATFSNPTLKELMVNVSKVYGFKYEITDKKVIIK